MNIKIAKTCRTTSNEALCIVAGTTTTVEIKAEEASSLYRIARDRQNHQLDHEVEPKDWTQPADSVRISEQIEGKEHTIQMFTGGSKIEHGVGSGTATYVGRSIIYLPEQGRRQ